MEWSVDGIPEDLGLPWFSETIFWKAKYLFLMSTMENQLAYSLYEKINGNFCMASYKSSQK